MSITYQWQQCDSSGSSCVDIPGATDISYQETSDDIGHTLRVVATQGATVLTSAPSPVVVAAPTPPAPGTGVYKPFGLSAGTSPTVDQDIHDSSWNWFSPHATLHTGGWNGLPYIRLKGDDSLTFPGQGALSRIHGFPFKEGVNPSWFGHEGNEVWRGVSYRVYSGSDMNNMEMTTCDEIHGDNGTGPAPLNVAFRRGTSDNWWRFFVRGSDFTTPNPPGGYPFEQNLFGQTRGDATYDGNYYRHQQDWAGGNKRVILDEWIHFKLGFKQSISRSVGWFEAWYRTATTGAWINCVPRKTGIRTSHPDITGDGQQTYPMMSLYYNTGSGSNQGLDYLGGVWCPSKADLDSVQDPLLGF